MPELDYGDAIRFCAIKPNVKAIGGFLGSKDYKNYTVKVHALKRSAWLIGAEALRG